MMPAAGWIFFVCVTTFIIMAVSNGSNLDDGMDGLCAGNSAIMSVALVILAYFSSHAGFADYFNIMNIPGCQELVVFGAAFVGALCKGLIYVPTSGERSFISHPMPDSMQRVIYYG